jgi:hypothetical protein
MKKESVRQTLMTLFKELEQDEADSDAVYDLDDGQQSGVLISVWTRFNEGVGYVRIDMHRVDPVPTAAPREGEPA